MPLFNARPFVVLVAICDVLELVWRDRLSISWHPSPRISSLLSWNHYYLTFEGICYFVMWELIQELSLLAETGL